jgi:dienelactone hydrolase
VDKKNQQPRQQLVVQPLLRLPINTTNTNSNNNTKSATTVVKRRILFQDKKSSKQQSSSSTAASILSTSFPSHIMGGGGNSTRKSTSQPQLTQQRSATTTTPFPNLTSSSLVQFSWCHCYQLQDYPQQRIEEAKIPILKLLVPIRGSLYVQHGIFDPQHSATAQEQQQHNTPCLRLVYDKSQHPPSPFRSCKTNNTANNNTPDAEDPQFSPDGRMVAFVVAGEIFVASTTSAATTHDHEDDHDTIIVQITFGATNTISHGVADFIAQEEMDRYRGFWWHPDSNGILFTQLDESHVPAYRILHQDVAVGNPTSAGLSSGGSSGGGDPSSSMTTPSTNSNPISNAATYEDHRYPFAGNANSTVTLGYVKVDYDCYFGAAASATTSATTTAGATAAMTVTEERKDAVEGDSGGTDSPTNNNRTNREAIARMAFETATWYDSPREASEYLARVNWCPDGSACAQWQNRTQNTLVLTRMTVQEQQQQATSEQQQLRKSSYSSTSKKKTAKPLLMERSQYVWINLHHMFQSLPLAIHPDECYGVVDNIIPLPNPLPVGSFSFLFASERTGYSHLYLYTYVPGHNGDQAVMIKSVSGCGEWMVESIVGVDMERDVVYVMGTYDSVLERNLYALPIMNHKMLQQRRQRGGATTDSGDHHPNEQHHQQPCHSLYEGNSNNHVDANHRQNQQQHHHHGVRRGLKSVMNALSGKSRRANATSSGAATDNSNVNGGTTFNCSNSNNTIYPIRLTTESGMHNIVMDDDCTIFVDTSSDLDRPTTVKLFALQYANDSNCNNNDCDEPASTIAATKATGSATVQAQYLLTLYDALYDEKTMTALNLTTTISSSSSTLSNYQPPKNCSPYSSKRPPLPQHRLITSLPAPELLSFPTSDGSETLHAALYRPDPSRHGPGPYPLVCAVYGGPHVQRVNRSWSQCADMRAQRLRSLGFCVVKCDNRGSSRRGMVFESSIARRLGRLEVLDQVATVRHLTLRGIVDPTRVGIYGWSYGGYLSAMCLCRAPDVFHVAVAGAPVTSWDGYDTHYTERYMGLPSENSSGYRESAVFDHVPNMRGKLMIVHGLIDENVHFRHTARLINRLIGAGKDYDLLIFPDERHSPRRLRDRIYMEQRISDYFVRHLGNNHQNYNTVCGGGSNNHDTANTSVAGLTMRTVPGHL